MKKTLSQIEWKPYSTYVGPATLESGRVVEVTSERYKHKALVREDGKCRWVPRKLITVECAS